MTFRNDNIFSSIMTAFNKLKLVSEVIHVSRKMLFFRLWSMPYMYIAGVFIVLKAMDKSWFTIIYRNNKEKFEENKGKSNERQCNEQEKNAQQTKNWDTPIPQNEGELMCSRLITRACFTGRTYMTTLIKMYECLS